MISNEVLVSRKADEILDEVQRLGAALGSTSGVREAIKDSQSTLRDRFEALREEIREHYQYRESDEVVFGPDEYDRH